MEKFCLINLTDVLDACMIVKILIKLPLYIESDTYLAISMEFFGERDAKADFKAIESFSQSPIIKTFLPFFDNFFINSYFSL